MISHVDPTPERPLRPHRYVARVEWTGNDGPGTRDYRSYRRDHIIHLPGKPDLAGTSDLAFRGDPTRYNPEELLVASLSACHMLWYLHLAAVNGIVVVAYDDPAEGTMVEAGADGGRFTGVTLHPHVGIASGDRDRAMGLHALAHEKCFIANSVNFPVRHEPVVEVVPSPDPGRTPT